MKKYVVGIDFGTLSARCIVADAYSGEELSEATFSYPHKVMDKELPSGKRLAPDSAYQHPQDYLDALGTVVKDAVAKANVRPDEIAAMGIDFTSCTVLAIDENGTPICFLPEFENNEHAYVKLWKHHTAQKEADDITELAKARGEKWINMYGGKVSSEWLFPKILETLRKAPEVYLATDRFIEAADWLSLVLTGEETHAVAFANYKALYTEQGYPDNAFLTALDPRLDGIVGTKVSERIRKISETAGSLNSRGAALTGLLVGTPLALPIIDAHSALPALGISSDGEMVMILGTSSCHILNSVDGAFIEGVLGYAKDSVFEGVYTYEAAQAAVGDSFDWFVSNYVPARYFEEANARGMNIHALLREKASRLGAGESGLLALDWLNGNRSVLNRSDLSGMILGLDLGTRPEEIYRAIIESTAYGARMILENYERGGIKIKRVCAAGGIAQKDKMMMQIYADVLGRDIEIAGATQAAALGSAINATVAAGIYENITDASKKLGRKSIATYTPNPDSQRIYDSLYAEYKTLHDLFGRNSDLMRKLKAMKK